MDALVRGVRQPRGEGAFIGRTGGVGSFGATRCAWASESVTRRCNSHFACATVQRTALGIDRTQLLARVRARRPNDLGRPAGRSAITAAQRAIGIDRMAGGHCGRIGCASAEDLSAGRASVAPGYRCPPVCGSGWRFPSERGAGIGESSGRTNRRILAIRIAAHVLPRAPPYGLRSSRDVRVAQAS